LKANPPYARLDALSAKIEAGFTAAATALGLPHRFNRVGSMWTLFFTGTPVVDLDTAKTVDTERFAKFFWAMMDRGIYLPCSQYEAAFTCAAMTDADVEETIAAAKASLEAIAV